jgi:signal transduction histidine kinase
MTPAVEEAQSTRRNERTPLPFAWAVALLLPALSAVVTQQTGLLHSIPAALLFASVAIAAWFGYALPMLVSVTSSVIYLHFMLAQASPEHAQQLSLLTREAVFCMVALLLAVPSVRLRRVLAELAVREADRHRSRLELETLLLRTQVAEAGLRDAVATYADQVKALALAQQAGKSASWIMDTRAKQVKWLPGGYEIFGIPFAEVEAGPPPVTLVEAEDQPAIWAALNHTLETGVPFTPEFRLHWPNGELHWQEARGVRDIEAPHVIRGTTFDITERKQAELGLLRVEKLAAVGRIASTIAHEINNPLASVTNLLYLALCDESIGEPVRGYLETAQQELSRLSNVTRLTLSYARPQSMARLVDPAEVVMNVLFLFRLRLEGKAIEVERVFREPVSIFLFSDELQRILTNLVANAIDALPPRGGVLRITVQQEDDHALVCVEDNGSGIPPERASRIFEPFYTTKGDVGTGIGLWVTKELAEKNGGSIALVSEGLENGMRTRFALRFPLADGQGSSVS